MRFVMAISGFVLTSLIWFSFWKVLGDNAAPTFIWAVATGVFWGAWYRL